MPSDELKNGLPAEIKMETSYVQNGETHQHSFEENGRVVYMNNSYYIRFEEAHELETIPVTIKTQSGRCCPADKTRRGTDDPAGL
ncbi:MAG: DUF1934 family protein [Alkalibacterium sp.]|nr:DUF1934 family protein [Alkalibacterium sp.]